MNISKWFCSIHEHTFLVFSSEKHPKGFCQTCLLEKLSESVRKYFCE